MDKATPVHPPTEPDVIDVDMTNLYTLLGVLSFATAGLATSTVLLWHRVRRNTEDVETLREYISRLVNETECGDMAFQSIVAAAEAEEQAESMANVDDFEPYPEQEPDGIENLYTREALQRFHDND